MKFNDSKTISASVRSKLHSGYITVVKRNCVKRLLLTVTIVIMIVEILLPQQLSLRKLTWHG